MRKYNNSRAITLIVLIVTIVVLLILVRSKYKYDNRKNRNTKYGNTIQQIMKVMMKQKMDFIILRQEQCKKKHIQLGQIL